MAARWQQGLKLIVAAALTICLFGFGGRVQMELSDLHIIDCPETPDFQNLPTSGASANRVSCYLIEGTVTNPTDRTIYNADIFGRLYDASDNEVWPERTRLGSVEEVPSGDSSFNIRISVPSTNPLPLQLKQFKAAGFRGKVNRS